MTSRRVSELDERVDALDKSKPKSTNLRSVLLQGLLSLTEDDQVCLAYLIRDLDKENVEAERFEGWLLTRPQCQQVLARRILADHKEAETN